MVNLSSKDGSETSNYDVYAFNGGKMIRLNAGQNGTPYTFGADVKFLIPSDRGVSPGELKNLGLELTEEASGAKVSLAHKILKTRKEYIMITPSRVLQPGAYNLRTPSSEYMFSVIAEKTDNDDFVVSP